MSEMTELTGIRKIIHTNANQNTAAVTVSNIPASEGVSDTLRIIPNPVEVEAVVIPNIHDTTGRLSDIITNYMVSTGEAVIPLAITPIASSVRDLRNYEIYELGGVRYAMRPEPRIEVVAAYKEDIINTLTSGVAYKKSLITDLKYNNQITQTLALSRAEWDLLLSMFRLYQCTLSLTAASDVILEILPERVSAE